MTQHDTGPSPEEAEHIKQVVEQVRMEVEANAARVAELGAWPPYIEAGSLLERIPKEEGQKAPGFDAGIACALDLIPRDKQELAARLHANYTKEAVLWVREEAKNIQPDSETAWWLAACSVCKEGKIDAAEFVRQIEAFKKLAQDDAARVSAAQDIFGRMTSSFRMKDGVPYGEKDGCIQGAYIAGYPFGTSYADSYDLYFIGTYEDSLGLEAFPWSDEVDEQGRAKSGPVFGSRQFVKCANEEELNRALEVVKAKLPFEAEEA